jgi:hypothetical protein
LLRNQDTSRIEFALEGQKRPHSKEKPESRNFENIL